MKRKNITWTNTHVFRWSAVIRPDRRTEKETKAEIERNARSAWNYMIAWRTPKWTGNIFGFTELYERHLNTTIKNYRTSFSFSDTNFQSSVGRQSGGSATPWVCCIESHLGFCPNLAYNIFVIKLFPLLYSDDFDDFLSTSPLGSKKK